MKISRAALIVVVFFAIPFMTIRGPFLNQNVVNEESLFLLVSNFSYRDLAFATTTPIGLCSGEIIREQPSHPSTHFAYFYAYGRILKWLGASTLNPDFTARLRFLQLFLMTLAVSLCLYRYLRTMKNDWTPGSLLALGLLATLTSPFFVGASIQLQWDGVIGTIPYLLILSTFIKPELSLGQQIQIFAFSFLAGLDKPERLSLWLICRAIAILIVPLLFRKRPKFSIRYVYEFSGYAGGILLLQWADFKNWHSSLTLANNMLQAKNSSFSEYKHFLELFIGSSFLLPLVIGIVIFLRYLWKLRSSRASGSLSNTDVGTSSMFGFSAAIFLAALYLRSIGDGFPRYVAPAMFPVAVVSWGLMAARANSLLIQRCLFILILFIFIRNVTDLKKYRGHSITSAFNYDFSLPLSCPDTQVRADCVVKIPYECAKNDYQNNFVLRENAPSIENQCRLPLCK